MPNQIVKYLIYNPHRVVLSREGIEIVWFQKLSIPSPWMVIGNSEGVGGFKGTDFLLY